MWAGLSLERAAYLGLVTTHDQSHMCVGCMGAVGGGAMLHRVARTHGRPDLISLPVVLSNAAVPVSRGRQSAGGPKGSLTEALGSDRRSSDSCRGCRAPRIRRRLWIEDPAVCADPCCGLCGQRQTDTEQLLTPTLNATRVHGSPGISPSRENTSQVLSGQEQRGDVFHFVLNQTSKRATMSAALDDLVDLKRRDCSTLRMISPC